MTRHDSAMLPRCGMLLIALQVCCAARAVLPPCGEHAGILLLRHVGEAVGLQGA